MWEHHYDDAWVPELQKNCSEIYTSGLTSPGVYNIQTDGATTTFLAYCKEGWTVIQRNLGDADFNRSDAEYWKGYKEGFGCLTKSFWLGNDAIYRLTKQSTYSLRIEMMGTGESNSYFWAQHSSFRIDDEARNYSLQLDGDFSGNVIDLLTNIYQNKPEWTANRMAFSTFDRDNDKWPDGNCATGFNAVLYKKRWTRNSRKGYLELPYYVVKPMLCQSFNWIQVGVEKFLCELISEDPERCGSTTMMTPGCQSYRKVAFKVNVSGKGAFRDCSEIYTSGLTSPGVFNIQTDGATTTFPAYCKDGWTVIQRNLGDEDFKRDWKGYKEGFGCLTRSFWLGNDAIYRLTKQSTYSLRIEMMGNCENNTYYWAQYSSFRIDDEARNYRLQIDGDFSGNVIDLLTYSSKNPLEWTANRMAFTTFDRDNDENPGGNCAVDFSCGWWMNCENNSYYWAQYSSFRIVDETRNFRLQIDGDFSGKVIDLLTYSSENPSEWTANRMAFTMFDRDNNENPDGNC
ncbi:uncharacterized protein LOC106181810 [Lingula anatina]|uniref:Uncharacterized protein LOC106181810 n=1 Tax=Lingula anatina TaxID=7574 RepID=A0A1S3KGI3_LINAN|nr:uncharacterized protein LOC106181810 [Lingula anatina]|eukprot:XP_013421748.1 uncharacterized protein LOC106181810 [Lingula anatina]